MVEIQRGDDEARSRALVAGVAVAAFLLILAGLPTAVGWGPDRVAEHLLKRPILWPIGGGVAVAPPLFLSIYLYVYGAQICRAERFPKPGQAVIRDTPVLTGAKAVRRGRIIQALAMALFLTSVSVPMLLWKLAGAMGLAT